MRVKGLTTLSGTQLVWTLLIIDGCNFVPFIKTAIVEAKQDAWISILIAGASVTVLTLLLVRLSLMHRGQTLFGFSRTVLGPWFGRIVVLPYFAAWLSISVMILRYSGDFIQSVLLDKAPVWVVMLILSILMMYAAHGGIGGIGRYNEVVGPLFFITTLVSFALNGRNLRWERVLPVYYDNGWQQIAKGAVPLTTLLGGESLLLLVLVAFMAHPRKASLLSSIAIAGTILPFVVITVLSLAVFGPALAARLQDPFFSYMRTVDIMEFIQQIDIFMFSLWIFGITAILSVHLFVVSYEMSLWLKLKNWYALIWILGPAVFATAMLSPGATMFGPFFRWWSYNAFPVCGIGIPLILWIATVASGRRMRQTAG
ncbi:endospore germination permease [Paenibacillus sp. MWE-103]|uniref:Endospore germination permease n=1 Tax=Paenibacillus artemisiicola TaxID=1172618 RepID=A0ABS3W5H8_9BACL|nr:endospore germination permease [Paenibacillus artemisiicola]MBO7743549.1 endospore germination permease [Paenibacillus artemisiicola]